MTKRPLIFFSGGLDSTALLYDRLAYHGNVDVVYACGNQHPIKAFAEEKARIKIIAYLHEHLPNRVINQYTLGSIEPKGNNAQGLAGANTSLWVQPLSWLLAALYTVDIEQHSGIEIGLVLGDQASGVADHLVKAWEHLSVVASPSQPLPPLAYPIRMWGKQQVIKSIPGELRELTWTCEQPHWVNATPIACGHCHPCLTLAMESQVWRESGYAASVFDDRKALDLINFDRFKEGKSPLKRLPSLKKKETS